MRLAPVLAAVARIGPGRRLRWRQRFGLRRRYRPLPRLDLGALLHLSHLSLLDLLLDLGALLSLSLATGALLGLDSLALCRLGGLTLRLDGLLLPPRLSPLRI